MDAVGVIEMLSDLEPDTGRGGGGGGSKGTGDDDSGGNCSKNTTNNYTLNILLTVNHTPLGQCWLLRSYRCLPQWLPGIAQSPPLVCLSDWRNIVYSETYTNGAFPCSMFNSKKTYIIIGCSK